MHRTLFIYLFNFLPGFLLFSQTFTGVNPAYKQNHFSLQKQASVRFDTISVDFKPALMVREMPKQGHEKMVHYAPRPEHSEKTQAANSSTLNSLALGISYFANPWSVSTPNDNDMAISDSGFVVSVINTNIHMRNVATGSVYPVKSLAAFTNPINANHQEFDPKVLYDPDRDRFILMCMVGFVDSTSKMIVGFSQSNDPSGAWNLYTIPGNPLNNNLWSDYPMIAITKKELFLSVNLLTNNSSWQTGFVETVVWQMKKDSGYAGLPLGTVLHSGIQFNGQPVRYLCPVKGGSQPHGPNMFFLSNRNFASQNDTVFLINITDTIAAPGGTITVGSLVTSQPYYFPPGGRQTIASQTLATNDARNMGAFYENGLIQYVHNTSNPLNNRVSVYYGLIANPGTASASASGYILPNDSLDYAYPNISYAGSSSNDNRAILSFDHSSNLKFAGCSAILSDAAGNFSPFRSIATGTNYINLLSGNLERWGDYSGSQRRYKNPGEVWMSGYYAYRYSSGYPYAHGAWVAQIFRDENMFTGLLPTQTHQVQEPRLYPNPADNLFSVEFELQSPEYLAFELFDASGRRVSLLFRDWVKVQQNTFSFSTENLSSGIYLLRISGSKTQIQKKVIVGK
ncbi:MAG TPA: T9SS type A sorting domain-containing protein [Bacteroidia bacterium]|nr:T9SS type A sorting domain-containing protein [Bacteroidia bacterium]